MKAFAMAGFDEAPALRDDMPEPEAGAGELLVRVLASSANPVDNAIAAGMLAQMLEHEFPVTLGRDYAGVVEGTGDEVFGYLPHAPFERYRIYTGDADTFSYSHQAQIAKFRGQYFAVWSNGVTHEDEPGQQVHYAVSPDGKQWGPHRCVLATSAGEGVTGTAAGPMSWSPPWAGRTPSPAIW